MKMKQIDLFKLSICDAMNVVRYLEETNLITKERAKELKRIILDDSGNSAGSDAEYWDECRKAHKHNEAISDQELLSVINGDRNE